MSDMEMTEKVDVFHLQDGGSREKKEINLTHILSIQAKHEAIFDGMPTRSNTTEHLPKPPFMWVEGVVS